MTEKTATAIECVNCKCALGEHAKELPFRTHDGEVWCPQCFVWKRTSMEPDRYYPPSYGALKCGARGCGHTSVDCGRGVCNQCGSRIVVALGPKAEKLADLLGLKI